MPIERLRTPPRLILTGEIDLAEAGDLRQAGMEAVAELRPDELLSVDMARVSFLDSSGLGALVSIRNAASEAGCTVAVAGEAEAGR